MSAKHEIEKIRLLSNNKVEFDKAIVNLLADATAKFFIKGAESVINQLKEFGYNDAYKLMESGQPTEEMLLDKFKELMK